jgi:competence protein ComEA
MDLPGVGPSKAKAIIAYREEHGPFAAPEDLMKVKGIGQKTFDGLKSRISVLP